IQRLLCDTMERVNDADQQLKKNGHVPPPPSPPAVVDHDTEFFGGVQRKRSVPILKESMTMLTCARKAAVFSLKDMPNRKRPAPEQIISDRYAGNFNFVGPAPPI
ncbi:hypothetical protein PFISCL1PPCAC_26656, partial [Pristionchus fissidentatus]